MAELHVPIYTASGKTEGTQALNPAVFGIAFKDPLVHQVVRAQLANRRQVLGHTKTRGEVRGGGKKPWKQKGTGRARVGSIRSPLWVGGGIIFGPRKNRSFGLGINKKMRQQALRMVLSDKVAHERLIVVDQWGLEEAKSKKLAALLTKLPTNKKKTTLVTVPADAAVIKASKNIPKLSSIGVGSLNVVDLLKAEYIVVPAKLIAAIEERYGV